MDVVLVGLPGSGKTAVGRRLAGRHAATFVDLDAEIERAAGATVAEIFAAEGEGGFRARERAAVEALGAPDDDPAIRRVIATGGGAVVDPRNRWRLYRGRAAIWLDGRPEVMAQRLRHSPTARPLLAGRNPVAALRDLRAGRARFYEPAARVDGTPEAASVLEAVEARLAELGATPSDGGEAAGTVVLRGDAAGATLVLGTGIAAAEIDRALTGLGARRAIVVTEPGAWSAVGAGLEAGLTGPGWTVESILVPQGEYAKRLAVVEELARRLTELGVERDEPIVAVGGGAVTDVAGFAAAIYRRGIPWLAVPTTLVGQFDAAIGGKTGVDTAEGKNLLGAFHQPAAIVIDIALVASLPVRERRAALAEAVKVGFLGDPRLLDVLAADGPAIAAGDAGAVESGALAEVVERTAWAKAEIVALDEREAAGRIALNLGHSLGHAIEAAAGFGAVLHGEAVAYGLRAAARVGVARGVTPAPRAAEIEGLLDRLELGRDPLDCSLDAVLAALATDKKHRGGRLRWVLPTDTGWTVDDEVPDELVRATAAGVLDPAARALAEAAR